MTATHALVHWRKGHRVPTRSGTPAVSGVRPAQPPAVSVVCGALRTASPHTSRQNVPLFRHLRPQLLRRTGHPFGSSVRAATLSCRSSSRSPLPLPSQSACCPPCRIAEGGGGGSPD